MTSIFEVAEYVGITLFKISKNEESQILKFVANYMTTVFSLAQGIPDFLTSLFEHLKALFPLIKFINCGGCMMSPNAFDSFGESEVF